MFSFGKCPGFPINKLLNQSEAMITIGTKLRKSTTLFGKVNFFNKTKGSTRDNQVANPQPRIVSMVILKAGMFKHHSKTTAKYGHYNNY